MPKYKHFSDCPLYKIIDHYFNTPLPLTYNNADGAKGLTYFPCSDKKITIHLWGGDGGDFIVEEFDNPRDYRHVVNPNADREHTMNFEQVIEYLDGYLRDYDG